ncbi:hypothetical protein IHE55_16645 [Streptomyces pactum]|uniref:Uncharacterized protein n=1 Tax=Streptomyces pactum TaxID=68249 RepID=A0ABS0NMC7_9ACTN|nr:DUF6177 family protein [Streptomyces pactum]MBH5336316.1 hypothetical protein [Streptomyces pactum]
MTKDVIVLTEQMPDNWTLLAGLLAGGPDVELRTAGDGAVIQLCDGGGRPLVSVEAPLLVRVPGEAARLLGEEAPEQRGPVWWLEARASTAVPEAEQVAGVFAGRLAHRLRGRIWPPDAVPAAGIEDPVALEGVTPAPVPAAAQPAVDVLTDQVAVVLQDRPVVAMTAWLSDALAAALASGRGLQIVTGAGCRLSLPTSSLLIGPGTRWVVRDGHGGYYDGRSGAVLHWHGGAFTTVGDRTAEVPVHQGYQHLATTGERQLTLTVHTRHPADDRLLLGGALEDVCRALTGSPPSGWGTAEPVPHPWSRRRLTEFARERSPAPTWFVAVGDPGARPAIATLTVSRTTGGVEEQLTFTAGYGPDDPPALDALPGLVGRLVREHRLVSTVAQVRAGRRDLTVPARLQAPPVPVAFVLGSEEVRDVGAEHAARPPIAAEPLRLGPATAPALYYPLGDGTSGAAWAAYEKLIRHLRPDMP